MTGPFVVHSHIKYPHILQTLHTKKSLSLSKQITLFQRYAISALAPLFFRVLNPSSTIAAPTPVVAMLVPTLTFRNVHFVMKTDSERMENLANDLPTFHSSHA
jgi:hypothetical protein